MDPKEKAVELYEKFYYATPSILDDKKQGLIAKKFALITVDVMIIQNGELYLNSFGDKVISFYREKNAYLFTVKQEIEKL